MDFNFNRPVFDENIYNIASKHDYFVVTSNYKHFKNLTKKCRAGVITLPSGLTTEEEDKLLYRFISNKNPEEYKGKWIDIHENSIKIK